MLLRASKLVVLTLAAVTALLLVSHPEEVYTLSRAELGRRQLEANRRHLQARKCAPQIAEFSTKRRPSVAMSPCRSMAVTSLVRFSTVKTNLAAAKTGCTAGGHGNGHGQPGGQGPSSFYLQHVQRSSSTATSADATITATASESTVIATGISTSTDIATSTASANSPTYSIIQNSTCVTAPEVTEGPYYVNNEYLRQDISENQEGVPLVLDIGSWIKWIENLSKATGQYSGFTTSDLAIPEDGVGDGLVPTNMTGQFAFLRGGWPTNSEGMVELRAYILDITNYSVATNGSIISHAGSLHHIGQLFFEETLNERIVTQGVYANTTQIRTYNAEDSILDSENADGYNAILSTELLGETERDGILAYITIGVDPTFSSSIYSSNYVNFG
ncbi:protocatechuate 3-aspergillus oryzae [Rhizoctonia solani]|uniref:Protocatechuate 3-aspergillus oryzae n=1 Tax=Rhizoctonia solani TaxID=456999 RepID=A0A8H7M8U1_9AGAM|nr:protocatechuate 3-aspergillus oryzae [Rhizoctonia solani]